LSSVDVTVTGTQPVLEAIASANDATYVANVTNQTVTALAVFALGDVPADLGNVDTLSVQLRYGLSAALSLNTWDSLTAQVMQSDGVTALTDTVTVASSITATTPANSSVVAFTGVNTSANKATWDGALLYVRFNVTRNKGGDAAEERVYAGELTGTYTIASVPDALTANDIATGAPTVGAPAIGQTHAFDGANVATGAPTVGAPAIGTEGTDALTANDIATGAPTVGTPAIGQTHVLDGASMATGAPSVGTPAIGQTHVLDGANVATGAPTVGAPAIGQTHVLDALGIAAGVPIFTAPTLAIPSAVTPGIVSLSSQRANSATVFARVVTNVTLRVDT
jgi:hypothetical protein